MSASIDHSSLSEESESQSTNAAANLLPKAADCIYTSCYCEENVWHLCDMIRTKRKEELAGCFCVFISNSEKKIPLWCQRSSTDHDGAVVWDYHVIFVHKTKSGTHVYDLDTTLDFPCHVNTYVEEAIKDDSGFKPHYRRMFRVIEAQTYLETFASNRSHMLDDSGHWLVEPPAYPCIHTAESSNNIADYITMDGAVGVGKVVNFIQLCDMFHGGG